MSRRIPVDGPVLVSACLAGRECTHQGTDRAHPEVLRLVAEGKTSKEIATVLDLREQTVRSYRKTIAVCSIGRCAISRNRLWNVL